MDADVLALFMALPLYQAAIQFVLVPAAFNTLFETVYLMLATMAPLATPLPSSNVTL